VCNVVKGSTTPTCAKCRMTRKGIFNKMTVFVYRYAGLGRTQKKHIESTEMRFFAAVFDYRRTENQLIWN
jgi:hypothetical protein